MGIKKKPKRKFPLKARPQYAYQYSLFYGGWEVVQRNGCRGIFYQRQFWKKNVRTQIYLFSRKHSKVDLYTKWKFVLKKQHQKERPICKTSNLSFSLRRICLGWEAEVCSIWTPLIRFPNSVAGNIWLRSHILVHISGIVNAKYATIFMR